MCGVVVDVGLVQGNIRVVLFVHVQVLYQAVFQEVLNITCHHSAVFINQTKVSRLNYLFVGSFSNRLQLFQILK